MHIPPHPNPLPEGEGDNGIAYHASRRGILDPVHILRWVLINKGPGGNVAVSLPQFLFTLAI